MIACSQLNYLLDYHHHSYEKDREKNIWCEKRLRMSILGGGWDDGSVKQAAFISPVKLVI